MATGRAASHARDRAAPAAGKALQKQKKEVGGTDKGDQSAAVNRILPEGKI